MADTENAAGSTTAMSTSLFLAQRETRKILILRSFMISLLVLTATLSSIGVYFYKVHVEHSNFVTSYENSATVVIDSFSDSVESTLGSVETMALSITSYAIRENLTFPFVTLPDFQLLGSNVRVSSGLSAIRYMPWVTDELREEWEKYAFEHRFHMDAAFQQEMQFLHQQDKRFGIGNENEDSMIMNSDNNRDLQQQPNMSMLDDGTGYHTKIWSTGAISPRGDEPKGTGPYLPVWQITPINAYKQGWLNLNFLHTFAFENSLEALMEEKGKAVMNRAMVPIPEFVSQIESELKIGQYREQVEEYVFDPLTYIAYPVYDTFQQNDDNNTQKIVGALGAGIYWKALFSNLLSKESYGIIMVVENSFGEVFSYRIDGPKATFLGMIDAHDLHYDHFEMSADVNTYLQTRASSQTRAYTTLPLNEKVGKYRISVYPSNDTEQMFTSNRPVTYTIVVASVFAFTSIIFLLFIRVVEKRQQYMMGTALANAQKTADTERELNEFLSHEVRNPLAAAMSACSFVSSALNEPQSLTDLSTREVFQEDVGVISTSLHFINDFLRSMLDIHRADLKQLHLHMSPTDLRNDVIEPVAAMLHTRVSHFDMIIECPSNLIVMADCLRLKQVVLNLVRNASKFVEKGFIRLRGEVVAGKAVLYVEDSGPGVPSTKKCNLFEKYQSSLDLLSQGTGIGLCLSKNLMIAMDGDLLFDGDYNSGIEGNPGARFVIKLNAEPIDLKSLPGNDEETDLETPPEVANQSDTEQSASCTTAMETVEEGGCNGSLLVEHLKKPLPTSLSVLFVDDDLVLRKLFKRAILKVEPTWEIQEAASGEKAIQLCEESSFDLIFMDQYMASVDKQLLGTEAIRALRTNGVKSVICGLSANDLKDTFVEAGADHFLLKPLPCATEDLRTSLLHILDR